MAATTVTREFEQLCEEEFRLAADECYDGLDEEIAQIKVAMHVSSATGQAVKTAVLMRFDKVLAAFDDAYLGKWRNDSARPLGKEDAEWLNQQVKKQLEPRGREAEGKAIENLHEATEFYQRYLEETRIEANKRIAKTQKKIELLRMQKNQSQPSASVQLMNNQPEVKIFISHSSADAAVAESVAELFRAALNLRAEEIRCTRSPSEK